MWLVSPRFDILWLHAGLWLLPVVATSVFLPDVVRLTLVAGTLLFWLGHRFASAQTAYRLPQYRALIQQEPVRFIWAPLAIFGIVIGFTWVPLGAGGDLSLHVRILATIFFLINTYHFGVQHFGVLSIYQIRGGQKLDDAAKRRQKQLCLLLGGVAVAVGQVLHGAQAVRDSLMGPLIPDQSQWLAGVKATLAGVLIVISLWWLRTESRRAPRSLPKLLYITGLGCQAVLAFVLDPLAFVLIWGLPHWLVSMGLAGHMASGAKTRGGFAWSVASLTLVSLVFAPLFYSVSTQATIDPPALYRPMLDLLQNQNFVRFATGVAFASVYCHFVLDRAIFRFSHPSVRQVTAPLVFSPRV